MAKDKVKPIENKENKPKDYEGYDIKWLKSVKSEHPDGHLVDEYEKQYGEVEV